MQGGGYCRVQPTSEKKRVPRGEAAAEEYRPVPLVETKRSTVRRDRHELRHELPSKNQPRHLGQVVRRVRNLRQALVPWMPVKIGRGRRSIKMTRGGLRACIRRRRRHREHCYRGGDDERKRKPDEGLQCSAPKKFKGQATDDVFRPDFVGPEFRFVREKRPASPAPLALSRHRWAPRILDLQPVR
jgi:hypothetical protein